MSLPRPVIAGRTLMVTRRCAQRQLLLRPSEKVNAVLGYCLAVAAQRYQVAVHGFCFLSNHVHLVLTDQRGQLPEFCRWLFEFTAKALNAHWGRWENLWSAGRPSVVHLVGEADQLDKMVYAITNPVAAGLVSAVHQWPGLVSLPNDAARSLTFKRPTGFFRQDGPLPDNVALKLTPLPLLDDMDDESYRGRLGHAVAEREATIAAARRRRGTRVLGRRAVLKQSHLDKPATPEPRRELNPRVACRDKWARIEALQRLREFTCAYRSAWHRWRSGDRDVLFPHGTYALRMYAGVCCTGPP